MKIELVMILTDDNKPVLSAPIEIIAEETIERLNRVIAGIDDPLTKKDTIGAIARDLASNPTDAINAVVNQFCNRLVNYPIPTLINPESVKPESEKAV
ncbi:MAG: hypothetical protein WC748_09950 [Legionellales bacterium]|jgi:hypothetical protein